MVTQLTELLNQTSMSTLKAHVQQKVDQSWQQIRDEHLPELEKIFAKGGDSAYGYYCRKLFEPIHAELMDAGIIPRPLMPGSFPQSEEHWGPWVERERRFWSVLQQSHGRVLGTLVTRIFHDHSRLRIPRPPQVYTISVTEPDQITPIIIHLSPEHAEALPGGTNHA